MPFKSEEKRRAYEKARAPRLRIYNWKRKGIAITLEEYKARWVQQNGRCAICSVEESSLNRALAVDHDHITGKIRGLLCQTCNSQVLPVVEHFKDRFTLASHYLVMYANK
jgi:hypothetical protein